MLHTVLRRRANAETVEDIQPDLFIPTGRPQRTEPRPLQHLPGLPGARRARKDSGVPGGVETVHADFAALQQRDRNPV